MMQNLNSLNEAGLKFNVLSFIQVDDNTTLVFLTMITYKQVNF